MYRRKSTSHNNDGGICGGMGVKELFLPLWRVWDWLYFHCNRMQYISKPHNIFRVIRKKYKGPPLETGDGTIILSGDEIIKIHLYNYRIATEIKNYSSEMAYIFHLKPLLEQSLKGLYHYIITLPQHENIKAIVGTTMLNRGAERFGFTVCDVKPTWRYWLKGMLYKTIYLLVHPEGWNYLKRHGQRLQSKHVVMSMETLKNRYSG